MISVLVYERSELESFQEYQVFNDVDAPPRKESLIRFEEAKNDLVTNVVGKKQEIINTD